MTAGIDNDRLWKDFMDKPDVLKIGWKLVDKKGSNVLQSTYDEIRKNSSNSLRVRQGTKEGIIQLRQDTLFSIFFAGIISIDENLFRVKEKEKKFRQ